MAYGVIKLSVLVPRVLARDPREFSARFRVILRTSNIPRHFFLSGLALVKKRSTIVRAIHVPNRSVLPKSEDYSGTVSETSSFHYDTFIRLHLFCRDICLAAVLDLRHSTITAP